MAASESGGPEPAFNGVDTRWPGPCDRGVEPARRSRRDPRQDKELDYVHQRRSGAEYPHAWRRAWPAKKARSRRAFRRGQAAALRTAQGRVDPVRVEQAVSRADRVHRRLPFVMGFPARPQQDHPDQPIVGDRIGHHLTITRLENVQRQEDVWKQDDVWQRKDWEK